MPKQEVPFAALQQYLPPDSFEDVLFFLQLHKVHLTVTRHRQSILGDYRYAHNGKAHRISVNGNLNQYSFLITLLHELAHLFTFEKFGPGIQSHGIQWKNEFSEILKKFLSKKVFPAEVENALLKTIKNPAASSCGDEKLLRVLRNYDEKKDGHLLVEQLKIGDIFKIKGGRIFKKGEKIRKRHKCLELSTGKCYLFSGVYEVLFDSTGYSNKELENSVTKT